MSRVLVLSAPYGSGHDRVAAALARAFTAEGAQVEVLDHFRQFVSPSFARVSVALFWTVLRWAPALWGLAYQLSARLPTPSAAMGGMDRLGATALGRHLLARRPDVVVHVHPTSAGALSWLRQAGATDVPHGIVFTDFVAHPQWIYPDLERYFVPTDEVADGVAARGIPSDRVVVSGLPVEAGFALPPGRAAARAELGLAGGRPIVLVTGGMRGALGGLAGACTALATIGRAGEPRFHALAVCGDHARLARRLRRRHAGDARFRIFGRADDMHRLMVAADLVVTKAGASTCAEALALGRPLVFYRSLPGQERANERVLEAAGVGVRARGRTALRRTLIALLGDAGGRRRAMAQAASALGRPDAAAVVAKEMLALARHA